MTTLDLETSKRIDAYLDTLGIDDWPLPNASQIDLLRRIFVDPTPTADANPASDAA